jgi:hypothetical protein
MDFESATGLPIFFRVACHSAHCVAQEYWLQFSALDREYRLAVRKLAEFCVRHAAA